MGYREERSKSDSRVLPLLSIDNRCTSCLERKQQTCEVFGLQASLAALTNKQTQTIFTTGRKLAATKAGAFLWKVISADVNPSVAGEARHKKFTMSLFVVLKEK